MELERHDVLAGVPQGLLRAEHFQMGYVTRDLDAARSLFGRRLGVAEFTRLEGQMPAGGHIRADFAWVGTLMYELIEASGPGSDLYNACLLAGDAVVAHHHLGFLVTDPAEWAAVPVQAAANGWSIPYRNANALLEGCFVAVPDLGHLLEYLHPSQAGLDFFAAVPRH